MYNEIILSFITGGTFCEFDFKLRIRFKNCTCNNFSYFVEIPSQSLPAADGWVMANIGQYGVYRVNYTEQNWRALMKQLKTNHKVPFNDI